jgi:hypothetical protein
VEPERCEQCGFDGAAYDDAALLAALRALGPRWRTLLAAAGDELRVRPTPATWSALEYAAHSRDVTLLHGFGVEAALTGDEPVLPAVEPGLVDAAAENYGAEDPDAVLDALDAAAVHLADLAAAQPDAWARGLTLGTERSDVRRLLEHALHDSTHHLDDVERDLTQLRGR